MDSTVLEAALPPHRQDGHPKDGAGIAGAPIPSPLDLATSSRGLRLLVRLHAEEPSAALLETLRREPVGRGPLALDRDDSQQAAALVDEVVSDLPDRITRSCLAPLVADFAAIHINGGLRACPTEGPWLEEKLRDDAAASLLRWRTGLGVEFGGPPLDRLADDHVAAELAVLAVLLDRGRTLDAVRFLDRHPLRWMPDFCSRVATRCREPFFAGIAILTNAYLDDLRDRLGDLCGLPRPVDDGSDVRRRRRWTEGRFPRACTCDP
ncbi:molecular chaperone TorD family protein [Azospirillum sp. TSH64]|uniref:TorD/DmsD family molecular chaperone n=1 Tax=Azospirillum sp. TSH64 TaxID=652740 RepID=UPI0020003583|nr:molecular chaperone TorD family protein [Azospirillum sp. TSH64]